MMKQYTTSDIKNQMVSLGHKWPAGIHIVGIRALKEIDDTFCDQLICFSPNQEPIQGVGTTVPSRVYLIKPMNPKGSAIVKDGQYIDSHEVGLHNGYKALIQRRPITVFRDSNRDAIINMNPGTEDTGLFNIDIHKYVSWISRLLGNASAGCFVWQDINKFNSMMAICEISGQKYFSLTVLNEF